MAIKLSNLKKEIKNSGTSKGKFLFFKEGTEKRIRFLTDLEEGMEIPFHDSFKRGINIPCQEIFGRNCEYCEDDDLRTRNMYAWSVYDYEDKEVKILFFAVNNCSPVPTLAAMYETYGTLVDRDYKIKQVGEKQNKTFNVVPLEERKFRGKVKPLSESAILKYIDKAYPSDDIDEDDYEEDYKKKKKTKTKEKTKIEEEWEEDEDEEEQEIDYEEMTAKELYKLCHERGIDCQPRKKKEYYIDLLEDEDEQELDDWEDEDEEE